MKTINKAVANLYGPLALTHVVQQDHSCVLAPCCGRSDQGVCPRRPRGQSMSSSRQASQARHLCLNLTRPGQLRTRPSTVSSLSVGSGPFPRQGEHRVRGACPAFCRQPRLRARSIRGDSPTQALSTQAKGPCPGGPGPGRVLVTVEEQGAPRPQGPAGYGGPASLEAPCAQKWCPSLPGLSLPILAKLRQLGDWGSDHHTPGSQDLKKVQGERRPHQGTRA